MIIVLILINQYNNLLTQGLNHNWLIGYTGINTNVTSTRAILGFADTSLNVSPASFAMSFGGVQVNISDENGNLLMYTNGCYIADASNNIMLNGDSLNPGAFADSWCSIGLPVTNTSVFLPYPGDSTKYILFH